MADPPSVDEFERWRRQTTTEFKEQYATQAGVEGTIAQGVRRCGMPWTRSIRLAKTHLGHAATAALNLIRVAAWLVKAPRSVTRCSAFAALAPVPAWPRILR